MNLIETRTQLDTIFEKKERALEECSNRKSLSALTLFSTDHLPLLLMYPLFSLLSPFRWIGQKSPTFGSLFVWPLVVPLFFLAAAAVYDKIIEHSSRPTVPGSAELDRKNFSLYLHLPVAAGGVFFVIHPIFGYLMLFFAELFSMVLTFRANRLYRGMTVLRSLITVVQVSLFFLIPAMVFGVVFNLVNTVVILRSIF